MKSREERLRVNCEELSVAKFAQTASSDKRCPSAMKVVTCTRAHLPRRSSSRMARLCTVCLHTRLFLVK
jgi:hypothetical protein